MKSAASTLHRSILAAAGLALAAALVGYCGGGDGDRIAAPLAREVTTVGRTLAQAPGTGPLTISSPAFADGAPIPVQYTCKGTDSRHP